MVALSRITQKADQFSLYSLELMHNLLAGCCIISLALLPIGDLGDPQGKLAVSELDTSVIKSGTVSPLSSTENVHIPSRTQVQGRMDLCLTI